MYDSENKKSKLYIVLAVLILLGIIGLIIFAKVKSNIEENNQNANDKNQYESMYINETVQSMNYSDYLINYTCEDFDEVCFGYDFNEIKSGLNMKHNYVLLTDKTYDEKYELKIEDNKVVLYVLNYENDKKIRRKLIFNTIDNPNGVFAYEGVGGQDSYPVDFWAIDNNNTIYYAHVLTRYCENNKCNSKIIKIIK